MICYASLNNDGVSGSFVNIYFSNKYNSKYRIEYKFTSPEVNNSGEGEFYAPTFTSDSSVDFSWYSGDWTEYVSSTYCALLISMGLDSFANASTYDIRVVER